MSPYYSYPPRARAMSWTIGQNLVESTKHERDIADLKKSLRKQNKEMQEKRKERKEKKVNKEKSCKTIDGYGNVDRRLGQQMGPSKKIIEVPEQVEKSGLTEEYEQPQNLCYISDGTQSKKRKRQESAETCDQGRPLKPIRIRLVFKKSKEPEAVPDKGAEAQTPIQKVEQVTITSGVASTSSSEQKERQNNCASIPIDTKKRKHKPSAGSQYKALIEDWVPPTMSHVLDDHGDEDWLFGTKKQAKPVAKTSKADETMNMSLSDGDFSWPKAQFLSDVGIHSLPYTVLF